MGTPGLKHCFQLKLSLQLKKSKLYFYISDNKDKKEVDEDELFLRSLLPQLKSLEEKKKCEVKIQLQHLLYKAQFSEQKVTF